MNLAEFRREVAAYDVALPAANANTDRILKDLNSRGTGYPRRYTPAHVRQMVVWQLLADGLGAPGGDRSELFREAYDLAATTPSGWWVWISDRRVGRTIEPSTAIFAKGAFLLRIPEWAA